MANRHARVQSLIFRYLSEILRHEIKNDKIGLVSLNDLILSKDYSQAKIYVSFFNEPYPHNNFLALLEAKGFIRSSLAKKVSLYKTPELIFIHDQRYEIQKNISNLLDQEKETLEKIKKNKK
ncbi:MAG: 30S ribosome-binding factor RbfA [Bacilli bacterium]|jgi:ribosome-binding factor A|nr:30S ribosome-binding factor RbfA [Bacilli bacterium]NLN80119.1 30S ribosome-binding factor RbfA [Erysipelotrichia bacterium]